MDVVCRPSTPFELLKIRSMTRSSPASFDVADRAAKRLRWLDRAWKRTADGQSTLSTDGYFIAVSFTGRTWSFAVRPRKCENDPTKCTGFQSADEAKLAAFDEITKRLKKNSRAFMAGTRRADGS